MPSRSRDKQLAKQHARRQAERHAAERRRKVTAGVVGAIIGVIAIVAGSFILFGGDEPAPVASAAPTVEPSDAPTGAEQPVACDADAPKTAGEAKDTYPEPPAVKDTIDPTGTYTATVETSCGTVVIELDAETAPQTVANFVFLAEEGFYDGLTFHRILPGFVIQGGDPLGDGTGGPGYQFEDETDPKVVFDTPGQLAMANSGPGTNGSQFFITLGGDEAAGHLNGLHTIFGQVTEGMDVVEQIAGVDLTDPAAGTPAETVYIESVTIDGP
jgi:peptidylprolyl isomerase